ncbi:hypothetical protein MMC13_001101 [Lambiella insularis]|nr:hypothetical protein [Lambiella insularis]
MADGLASSQKPQGPAFIDAALCRCALQSSNRLDPYDAEPNPEAWRCIGENSADIYNGSTGMWFLPVRTKSSADLHEPDNWAGNPPDLTQVYIVDNGTGMFEVYAGEQSGYLSSADQACTGLNDTTQSEQYYASFQKSPSTTQQPCLQAGGQPINIQNATSWNQTGCSLGFFCKSIIPLRRIPSSTEKDQSVLPIALLLAFDFLLVLSIAWVKIAAYLKRKDSGHRQNSRFSLRRAATYLNESRRHKQYHSLADDNDISLESRILKVQPTPTGFHELMGSDFVYDPEHVDTNQPSSDLHLFVQSLSKCIGATKFGLSFGFENLSFQPSKADKPILSQVTGYIGHGSLWGVMGASGAGKSTFVNVLMGKQAHTGGVTKINGIPGKISKYKKIIGYVPQDDVVLPELTVRENILHSARIRLPSNWSDEEIQKHVDILISCLQLSHVQHSLVGNPAKPVISGGQRKRCSIGIELAAGPMALFLDEPTSGLDATSASSIMMTLKALSRLGITVVTIIHQPRQEIFESLDSLILLGAGRMIYQGREADAGTYFEGLGFRFPEHGNPADVVGDIIAGEGHLYKKTGDTNVQSLIDHWQHTQQKVGGGSPYTEAVSVQETQALWRSIKLRGAPLHRQIYFCFRRSLTQQIRLKSSFFFELGVGAIAGFLIGLAELNEDGINFRGVFLPPYDILSSSLDYSGIPQMSLLVGLAIGLMASSPGVKIFGEEKLVYWREAGAGHNRFCYYIGKVFSTVPRMIIASMHFTVLFLLMSTPKISFGDAFLANLLYYYCVYGLASIVSMVTRREDGPLLATLTSLIVGVLNGMSPSLKKVADWHMTWFWRACPGAWLAEGYFTKNITPYAYLYQIDDAAASVGYTLDQFRLDMVMLLCLGTAYRVVAFLGLRFVNRRKQK